MYKNGSSWPALGAIEEVSVGNDGSEATAPDDPRAGEEGSEKSLSAEEPRDETFTCRKERLDPELSELGNAGWSVTLELEEAHGLGEGCMSQ